jgi:uncharacterized protein
MKNIWLTSLMSIALIGTAILSGCSAATTAQNTTTSTSAANAQTTIIATLPSNNVVSPVTNNAATSGSGSTAIIYSSSQGAGISVNGTGVITVAPDIAQITLGVQSKQNTVAAAQTQANTAMNAVMAALKANNIADKDIQTSQFSINPVYTYNNTTGQSTVTGYSVTNTVNVKIRDLTKVGSIIDAVAAAGGDNTVINGISFLVDDPTQYYAQARTLAMNDAKSKATQLASAAGVTLGAPIFISESTYSQSGTVYYAKDALGGSSTPISAGESNVTINVQVNYAIQ